MIEKEKTIKLSIPIQYGDRETNKPVTITELKCRRLKVKDLRKAKKELPPDCSQEEEGYKLLSYMTGLPDEAIDEIDVLDLNKTMEELAPFLGN